MAKIIDATRALGPQSIREFKENHKDDAEVVMYVEEYNKLFTKTLSDLRQFFEDDEIHSAIVSDKCVIYFMFSEDDTMLKFCGFDYKWWTSPYRKKPLGRLKMLFDDNVESTKDDTSKKVKTKTIKVESLYKCEIVKPLHDDLEVVDKFEGKLKDMISFINKNRQLDLLRTFFKSDILYSINDSEFKTYEKLVEEGVFVL